MQPPLRNHLLSCLPSDAANRWKPHLEPVDMSLGQILHETDKTPPYVYFPITAIVSIIYVMESGASATIAVVGREGIVGVSMFMGGDSIPGLAIVQRAGRALRLDAKFLQREFLQEAPVMHLLLRYTQALIAQMGQTAACNRHHLLTQQLCRWLLMNLDCNDGDELTMTQELLASLIGVRRESITAHAALLKYNGLIRYTRGRIKVLDRGGLTRLSCECYSVVRKEYDRLLPSAVCE